MILIIVFIVSMTMMMVIVKIIIKPLIFKKGTQLAKTVLSGPL